MSNILFKLRIWILRIFHDKQSLQYRVVVVVVVVCTALLELRKWSESKGDLLFLTSRS
jgi:hypothetical protein